MTIRVAEGQPSDEGQVVGGFTLIGEGDGELARFLRPLVGRAFASASDVLSEITDAPGNFALSLERGGLRMAEVPLLQLSFVGPQGERAKAITGEILLGRDASADVCLRSHEASRLHARIWMEGGCCWIEDAGSSNGTFVDDRIVSGPRSPLRAGQVLRMGNVILRVRPLDPRSLTGPPAIALAPNEDSQTIPPAPQPDKEETLDGAERALPSTVLPVPERPDTIDGNDMYVSKELTAHVSDDALDADARGMARRLEMLYHLALSFEAEEPLDALARVIVENLVGAIPNATRGALLLTDEHDGRGELLLKAYVSPDRPAVSLTLARRAMIEGKGFIYDGVFPDAAASITTHRIKSSIYAPLLRHRKTLGIVCVDNPDEYRAFDEGDLRFLLSVSHFAALALANHRLHRELEQEAATRANLLVHFSPKIAERLTKHRGRVRLGGTRSEVTILCADIRGFTGLVRDMQPDDVVDLLNAYFSRLIPVLFAHDGTVDKYVGDAVLTVFGSPDPDPDQHKKAVRAAWRMQEAIRELNVRRASRGEVVCQMGIGVHCGEVVHGFIGSTERMEYTVIGDAVNYASLYCAGAGPGEVIISPDVHEHVWRMAPAAQAVITTKHEGDIRAYRVLEVRD